MKGTERSEKQQVKRRERVGERARCNGCECEMLENASVDFLQHLQVGRCDGEEGAPPSSRARLTSNCNCVVSCRSSSRSSSSSSGKMDTSAGRHNERLSGDGDAPASSVRRISTRLFRRARRLQSAARRSGRRPAFQQRLQIQQIQALLLHLIQTHLASLSKRRKCTVEERVFHRLLRTGHTTQRAKRGGCQAARKERLGQ